MVALRRIAARTVIVPATPMPATRTRVSLALNPGYATAHATLRTNP